MLTLQERLGVNGLELENRKKKILGMVVSAYIRSGEPVGSKTVQNDPSLNVSSATIRNEMAALESMGLLYQPHTSAGRVPSVKGYRLFVDEIMPTHILTKDEKIVIDSFIAELRQSVSSITKDIAKIASELTGCAAIALTPSSGGIVQMFEAVIAGKRIVTVLAVSATGQVKTKSCVMDCDIDAQHTLILTRILNELFSGMSPDDIADIKMEVLQEQVKRYCPQLEGIIPVLKMFIQELRGYDVYVGGESKVLSFPEFSDIDKARAFMAVLSDSDTLSQIASQHREGITVDVMENNISDISMITSAFKSGNHENVLSVLGPTRMDYARVLAKMNYFTDSITKLINGKD